MIEFLLIFALGFLAAAMLAVLVTPAIYGRIVKLTEKRIESTVPLSQAEIKGKTDLLRAGFASQTAKLTAQLKSAEERQAHGEILAGQLRSDLAQISGARQQAQQQIEELVTEGAELRSESRKNQQLIEKLTDSLREFERIKKADNAQIARLHSELVHVSTEVESMKIDLATSGTETVSMKAEVDSLRDERDQLQRDIQTIADAAKDAEKRLQREQENSNENRIELAAAMSNLEERELRLRDADERIALYDKKVRITETTNKELTQALKKAQKQIETLDGRIRTSKLATEKSKAAEQDHKSRVGELKAETRLLRKENKLVAELANDLEQHLEREQQNNAKLSQALDSAQHNLVLSDTKLAEAVGATKQQQNDLRKLNSNADRHIQARQVAEERTSQLEDQIGQLKNELRLSQEMSAQFRQQVEKMQSGVNALSTRAMTGQSETVEAQIPLAEEADRPTTSRDVGGAVKKRIDDLRQRHSILVEKLKNAPDSSSDTRMREEIASIAAAVVGLSGQREGVRSPIHKIISDAGVQRRPAQARLSLAARTKSELEN